MQELILKSCNNSLFDLKLKLMINDTFGEETIYLLVALTNQANNKKQIRTFDAKKFADALCYYAQQEEMFMKM